MMACLSSACSGLMLALVAQTPSTSEAPAPTTLSGCVRDVESKLPLSGVLVGWLLGPKTEPVRTNLDGWFSIGVPVGVQGPVLVVTGGTKWGTRTLVGLTSGRELVIELWPNRPGLPHAAIAQMVAEYATLRALDAPLLANTLMREEIAASLKGMPETDLSPEAIFLVKEERRRWHDLALSGHHGRDSASPGVKATGTLWRVPID